GDPAAHADYERARRPLGARPAAHPSRGARPEIRCCSYRCAHGRGEGGPPRRTDTKSRRKDSPMTGTKTSRRSRPAAGFTLLEMMLVVVIIGVLATVVVVNLAGSSDEARRGATIATLSQVKQALQNYYRKHGSYPQSLTQLAEGTNPLLERIPTDAWKRDL